MKRVYKNIVSSALPQIVNIITNFILPGLIIAKFGSEINGLVSTTKTIVSYISLVGAGIATAVTQSLYGPVAKNDVNEIKGMLHSANSMFVRYGIIYCAVTALVACLYPFAVSSQVDYLTIALLLIVMSVSGASEFFVTGRCRALLYACQKVYVCNVIQALSLSLGLVVAIIMIKIDVDIILVQLAISLIYVFRAAILLAYVNRCYPQLRGFSSAPLISRAVSKRNDVLVHMLSGLCVTGSQSLILSVLVGLEAASIYAIYNIIFSGLQSICANVNTALTPYIGKELSIGNDERASRIYDAIELLFVLLVEFIFIITAILILPFIKLYTAGADINYIYKDFALIFVFSSMFYILKLPSNAVVNAAGHFKETRSRAIAEATICVVLGVALTIIFGQNGVLMGSLVALGYRCFDTVFYVNKHVFKSVSYRSVRRILVCLLLVASASAVAWNFDFTSNSYGEWALHALMLAGVAILIAGLQLALTERRTVGVIMSFVKRS